MRQSVIIKCDKLVKELNFNKNELKLELEEKLNNASSEEKHQLFHETYSKDKNYILHGEITRKSSELKIRLTHIDKVINHEKVDTSELFSLKI